MKSRWKHDKPMSRSSFDSRFPDEAACARHLAHLRWPDGFACPACGVRKAWELQTKPFTWECSGCHRQTSVTAGTVMHRSKLPLRTWFEAIHLMTCHSNGISAEQAQAQLGLGSYKTAWLLLHKLRRPWSIQIGRCCKRWSRSTRLRCRCAQSTTSSRITAFPM